MATQKEEVLRYIKQRGSITRLEAILDLGIFELSSRICTLEKEGYQFNKKRERFTTRLGKQSSYIRYSLKEN